MEVTGDTGDYYYAWTGISGGASTLSLSGLRAGVYTCTVTDASSCTRVRSITITQPTGMMSFF